MWNDHNPETKNPATDEDTPLETPKSGPTTQQPVSPKPARASFSAIGAPKAESITPATGAIPSRPVAEVNVAPAPAPSALGAALPPSVGRPEQSSVFTTQRIAAVAPSNPELDTAGAKPKKRRTGLLALLALLTVLASGAVSFFVANAVADDVASSASPQPLPTAASAPLSLIHI